MASATARIIGQEGTHVGPIYHDFIRCHLDETKNQAQEERSDRAMANIQCANTGNEIRPKKDSPDRAMANSSATIIGHQGTDVGLMQHSFTGCHGDKTPKQVQ